MESIYYRKVFFYRWNTEFPIYHISTPLIRKHLEDKYSYSFYELTGISIKQNSIFMYNLIIRKHHG